MSFLQEIRRQPEHIRHVMMWLCVIIVFSLVSFVWFKSTQARFVAMLHPQEMPEENILGNFALNPAKGQETGNDLSASSPLANIWQSFSLLKASLGELIFGESGGVSPGTEKSPSVLKQDTLRQEEGFRILPLSRDR